MSVETKLFGSVAVGLAEVLGVVSAIAFACPGLARRRRTQCAKQTLTYQTLAGWAIVGVVMLAASAGTGCVGGGCALNATADGHAHD